MIFYLVNMDFSPLALPTTRQGVNLKKARSDSVILWNAKMNPDWNTHCSLLKDAAQISSNIPHYRNFLIEKERHVPYGASEVRNWTCLNSSLDLKTDSGPKPTLPEGTDVKKGESPNINPSSVLAGGERKTSTSEARANWGILVSSFVATTTVLESSGSICIRFHTWKK